MIPVTPQGQLAVIVGAIALCAVWAVILIGLAREKRLQAKNRDDH